MAQGNERKIIFEKPISREEHLAKDPLGKFFVPWMEVTQEDADALLRRIDSASNERDMQAYLNDNPVSLIQHLGGGHGRYVIPQKRLGSELITDFVIGEKNSDGFFWQAVEIESPKAKMFNRNGDSSQTLNHAIRQITDWRTWLEKNQPYAARLIADQGLGLTDIAAKVRGLIVIGRRSEIDPATNPRRRQMQSDLDIQIHSYDFLVEQCVGNALGWAKIRKSVRTTDGSSGS